MILSAIGLPMSGPSVINLPPPPGERPEAVASVGAAVATGGASRTRDSDTNAGSGAGRQAARDEARVIRVGAGASGTAPEKIAGPQPAFEIAVLEKLREDAMRAPPEESDVPPPQAETAPVTPARRPAEDRATDADQRAATTDEATPTGTQVAATNPAPETPREADRADRAARSDAPRDRAREPADEGFDDARRMSVEPSPRRMDVTR